MIGPKKGEAYTLVWLRLLCYKVRTPVIACALLFPACILQAQGQVHGAHKWGAEVSGSLVWNIVVGDRYVVPLVYPGVPPKDVDVSRWRSYARNSLSPCIGGLASRNMLGDFWLSSGIELIERKSRYVFDEDTLSAHPLPGGLSLKVVTDHRYRIELPLLVEWRHSHWRCGLGANWMLYERYVCRKEGIDGVTVTAADYSGRNPSTRFVPRFLIGYAGTSSAQRVGASIGVDWRPHTEYEKRRLDIRATVFFCLKG